jgi:uncharacterized YigZ family protein
MISGMRVPTRTAEAEFEARKSRFISYAVPISDAKEVKPAVERLRKEHPQASHVVHAFIIGDTGDQFGMSDDHEPKNTAGRPVLEVLKGSGLTNILVLVVRYFGGTKLGTGGLVKAYTRSAQLVLEHLPSEQIIKRYTIRVICGYELFEPVNTILTEHKADRLERQFLTEVTITGRIPAREYEPASTAVRDVSSGSCALERLPATASPDE